MSDTATAARRTKPKKTLDIIARHDYKDATGATIYQVVESRDGSKRVRSPDPKDPSQWRWGRAKWGIPAVPYRLPELIRAGAAGVQSFLWVVPTERDADALFAHGRFATCAVWDGEPKDNDWKDEWGQWLQNFHGAVILVRNDPPPAKRDAASVLNAFTGQRRAERVRQCLLKHYREERVKCVILPEINGVIPSGVAQWYDAGGTDDVLKTIVRAAPPWTCPDGAELLPPGALDLALQEAAQAADRPGIESRAAASPTSGLSGAGFPPPAASAAAPTERAAENVGGARDGGTAGERGGGEFASPTSVAFLRGALISVMADRESSPGQKKRLLCDTVSAWMNTRGRFFYDVSDKTHAAAMWFDAIDKRLHRVNQDYFASWLSRATSFNRELRDFRFFMSAVEDESLVGDNTAGVEPRRYWARKGDAVYVSCGEGRAVRVKADGVETVDNGTDDIVFEQDFSMDAWTLLPEEQSADPFERCSVFSGMATLDGRGKTLLKLWFCSMFGVTGWKPLMVLTGTVGSGKTRVASALFELLGMPSRVTNIDTLGNVKDFWTSIDKGGLYVLDNADHHIQWLPDALSVISTGGTFEKKKLYTDTSTITQKARCWAVVTSASPTFASDAGLADRLITIQLERVERDTAESSLVREIAEARDAGLSWVCHMMRKALADREPVPRGLNRRHPDWAEWAFRLGRAAGDEEGSRKAISENEAFKSIFAISNDGFGKFLLTGIKAPFEGSVSDLSALLAEKCEGYSRDVWTDAKIGKAMKRMEAHLKSVFAMEKVNHNGRAVYRLQARKDDAVDLPPPEPDLLSTPHNVGIVGGAATKVPENTILPDFYTSTPNIPNSVGGCVETESTEDGPSGPREDAGWDSL